MASRAWMPTLSILLLCTLSSLANANSLRFFGNGVNDIDRAKIQIDDPANSNPGPPADIGATDFTIEFWIKGTLADNRGSARCGNTYGWIDGNTVIDRDRYNQPRSFGISLGNGRIAFGANVANNVTTLCGSRNVLDGQWHHVAVTRERNSGTLRLFVDGIADGSATGPSGDLSYPDNGVPGNYCSGSCAFSDPYIVIGAEKHDAGPSYPSFRGFFDELRLSTALRYFGSFSVPTQPFTVDGATAALYHFDASSGTTVADAVGSSPGILRVGGNPQGPLWSTDTPFPGGGPGTLSLQNATYTVSENGSSVSVTVERTGGSTGSASVTYQTSGGTATPGADYNGASGTLNWASGDAQPKVFSIAVLDDAVDEPDETVGIQLTGASGASLGTPAAATLTIVDNDATVQHGSLRFSSASYSVAEGGGSVTLTVNRVFGSDGAVAVSYATSNGTATSGADYTASNGVLSWPNGDVSDKTFSVSVASDALVEGNETVNLTLSAPSGGATLGSPTTSVLTITDSTPNPGGGFADAFERPNGAALGNGWIERDPNAFSLNAGRAAKNTSAGSSGDVLVYRPATENLGDVEISIEMRLTGTNVGYPQIFTRLQTGSLGSGTVVRYVLYVNGMLGNAVLARQNGSSLATLGTLNLSPSLNTTDTFRLRMRTSGTSPVAVAAFIERNVAGAWQIIGQISVNDSAAARIAAAGSTGFGGFTENTYSFDNFVRTAMGAGGAGASAPPSAFEISPSQAMAGESGLIVVVSGADFTPDSRVRWNGEERATTFISPTELEAQIDARDLGVAGWAAVDVLTPGPGGGLSNPWQFTISPAAVTVRTAPQPPAAQ